MQYDLFSVDDHIIEPPNVWIDRLPAAYQEAGPHVVEDDDRQFWLYEGRRGETMGLNAVAGKELRGVLDGPGPLLRHDPRLLRPGRSAPRTCSPTACAASVCFPTFPRFAGVTFLKSDDKVLADLCVKAYNDWVIDEWCASVPGMYVPMIIGQLWDPLLMAAEIRRCAAHGARAVTFPENPVPLGLPSFWTDYWDPVWQACVETDTVVCIHIGTSGVVPMASSDSPFIQGIALAPTAAWMHVHGPHHGRIPRAFPTIKFTLSEGGIGWVPFALERADRQWERHRYWSGMDDVRPSDVFRRNVWVCFIDEGVGIETRHHIGVDRILWECDYPHADTPWPHSQKEVAESLAGVPDDEVALITHGNAERLFRWDAKPDVAALGLR